jgi:hypothetical protein
VTFETGLAQCLELTREHEHLYVAKILLPGWKDYGIVRVKITEFFLSGQLIKTTSLDRRVDYEILPHVNVRVELYRLVAAADYAVENSFPRSLGPVPLDS